MLVATGLVAAVPTAATGLNDWSDTFGPASRIGVTRAALNMTALIGTYCVACPWHGSTFRLADRSVVNGQAAAPEPSYEARIEGGRVQVRARR